MAEPSVVSDPTAEREAICLLKARYFRYMDQKDWDNWASVFAEDVVVLVDSAVSNGFELTAPHDLVTGRDAFVGHIRVFLAEVSTVHHGHMPEIAIISPTEATGIWAMEDKLIWPDGTTLHGYGHYREHYRKEDGQWRIARLELSRLRMDHGHIRERLDV
jgi:hypothetical protein